jgi:hypothetical protein
MKRSARTRRPERGLVVRERSFPRRVVEHLRGLGHDVLTTHDAGNSDQAIPDEQVLAFAIEQGREVLARCVKDSAVG